MGERLGGDGVRGRRRVQPGGALSDPWDAGDDAALETALAAAVRAGDLASQGEQQAVAAFRAARAAGAHRARTRRRDDWRPAAERRAGRPAKLTFGVVFASLALGGVAVAAIGSAGSSTEGAGHGRGTTNPSAAASDRPGGAAPSPSSGSDRPADRPATAQDTEAHCRAYEQIQGHGKALAATAWQRLVAAAGGADKVAAYCAEQLAAATAKPGHSTGAGKSGKSAANSANGTAGETGASGNASANSQANGGQGNGKKK
ncbi:hypothetical protein [Streptomyces hyaluromycini]|uniref:hypothetical protein n=1 Tax=Streptomyces hyaluromycini TaxID=1377993 RepID=UPI000B5C478C|nr:hypothetical protein [Streptomyces hyaluromycini]